VKRLADQTFYEILEVPHDAAPPDILAAYDRARSLFGPGSLATYTLMTPEEAALLTSRIEEAKQTLLDAGARSRYDASLAAPEAGAHGANGSVAPPFAAVPPVIPAVIRAVQAAAPAPEPRQAATPEPPARPAEAADAALASAPPSPLVAPARALPIRLDREVASAAPAATPLPAAAPVAAAPAEIPIPEGSLWTGEALRRVHEARGFTVRQIAERTKVTRHHVENIEAERFSALPAPVYLRGILLSLARELRLDGQKVARAYLERAGVGSPGQGGGAR